MTESRSSWSVSPFHCTACSEYGCYVQYILCDYAATYETLSVACSSAQLATAECKAARRSSSDGAARFAFIAATIGCVAAVIADTCHHLTNRKFLTYRRPFFKHVIYLNPKNTDNIINFFASWFNGTYFVRLDI